MWRKEISFPVFELYVYITLSFPFVMVLMVVIIVVVPEKKQSERGKRSRIMFQIPLIRGRYGP